MNRALEKRLELVERQAEAAAPQAQANSAPCRLQVALEKASDDGLMRLERMLADWPRDVLIPPAAVLAALDLPPEIAASSDQQATDLRWRICHGQRVEL